MEVGTSLRGDGQPIEPGDGIVPIVRELTVGRLKVVGTGFYITRYGVVATAKHVIEDLAASADAVSGFVLHLGPVNTIYMRRIRRAHLLKAADVGVLQADNYVDSYPNDALRNKRGRLSTRMPLPGESLITYAYPENAILEFGTPGNIPVIRGDYFGGRFLRFVSPSEHPFLPFPYFESTIEIRSGASGGPVFNPSGNIVGINCRGWDFRGGEHEGIPLSYIVPIGFLLDLLIDPFMIPANSWEARQIPPALTGQSLSIEDLSRLGHVVLRSE
jgi:trypsin-like peptidase